MSKSPRIDCLGMTEMRKQANQILLEFSIAKNICDTVENRAETQSYQLNYNEFLHLKFAINNIPYLLAELDKYRALAENGQSAIDTNKRLLVEIKSLQKQIDQYQEPMLVFQTMWSPSQCPRCYMHFGNYEDCNDGYYKRACSLKRCPYCGQKIKWE